MKDLFIGSKEWDELQKVTEEKKKLFPFQLVLHFQVSTRTETNKEDGLPNNGNFKVRRKNGFGFYGIKSKNLYGTSEK